MINVTAPASKSLSHRYLIAAALANGTSLLSNVLESEDTLLTKEILSLAGAKIERLEQGVFRIQGTDGRLWGGKKEPLSCYMHESGTSCRLLTAVLAAGKGQFHIYGCPRLNDRPIGGLVDALRCLGCDISYSEKEGYPPLQIRACGLRIDGLTAVEHVARHALYVSMEESSQYFSGLLMASPMIDDLFTFVLGGTKVVSWPYIGLTLQCLYDFNVKFLVEVREEDHPDSAWEACNWKTLTDVKPNCLRIKVQPGDYYSGNFHVEGDWSGASYLVAAGLLGREQTCIHGVRPDSLQGDRALVDIITKMGAKYLFNKQSMTVMPVPLHGISVDMSQCPDLVPTVAVLAAFAEGRTDITNVAHLRIKESDRIKASADALRMIGVTVEEHEDGLSIFGLGADAKISLEGLVLKTSNDHRMAMSQALFALKAVDIRPGEIYRLMDDPKVVSKSFPDFWQRFEAFDNA